MAPLATQKKKLLEIINDLSSPHVEKLIIYAEHLKTIENIKSKSSGKTKRIKVPSLHLGHIGENATDRESLYKEYLNHKFD